LLVTTAQPIASFRSANLGGRIRVPGDKSISHRALILGGLAAGETVIDGLLEAEDVLATAAAMRALGCGVDRDGDGRWRVRGAGTGGLTEPEAPLDFGNSGTGARLMMGVVASHPITATFTGDESLCRRPMGRVLAPLMRMGARVAEAGRDRLPLTLIGTGDAVPAEHVLEVPSAQVKSAILLAGLNTAGTTSVIERAATRDHTERMLAHFGVDVRIDDASGGRRIAVDGYQELKAKPLTVPADPSSAAFPLVAALITPGSDLVLEGVAVNPTRSGLLTTLIEMGGRIELLNERIESGEPVADIRVRESALKAVTVPAERAPSMIDEYPVLAVAAACAEGDTVMHGLSELRVKESDRLAAVAAGLAACGVRHGVDGDDLIVSGGPVPGGGEVAVCMDHRIGMAFLVLGLAAERPVTIDDGRMIATSFPGFTDLMRTAGADMRDGGAGGR